MLGSAPLRSSLRRIVALVLVLAACVALSAGCTTERSEPSVEPQVAPPAVAQEGVLTVGVNVGSAPYATELDGGGYTGLDVELAEAIADNLGLEPKFVAVAPDEVDEALAAATVDMVMSVPVGSTEATVVGSYLTAGAAIYSARETESELTGSSLGAEVVSVQTNSPAYWWFIQSRGAGSVKAYALADEALRAAELGEVTYAAVDSVVGQYAISAGSELHQVGWVSGSAQRGIALRADNLDLISAVQDQVATLDGAGWIEALVRRWLEPTPSGGASGEASSTTTE